MKLARSLFLVAALGTSAHAQSALDILKMLDTARHAFNDLRLDSKMTIYEPGQSAGREVTFTTQLKGDKRLVRFTSPADVRGMGLLTEGRDTMYALLPAFGNRIRRMGTHVKNQSFMGSDVPNEEVAGGNYADVFVPKLAGTEGNNWILELAIKPGQESIYPRQKVWIDKSHHQITRCEYYDEKGTNALSVVSTDFKKDDGSADHYSPRMITYVDHYRNDHKTTLEISNVRANTGIPDDTFTQRGLQRTTN